MHKHNIKILSGFVRFQMNQLQMYLGLYNVILLIFVAITVGNREAIILTIIMSIGLFFIMVLNHKFIYAEWQTYQFDKSPRHKELIELLRENNKLLKELKRGY